MIADGDRALRRRRAARQRPQPRGGSGVSDELLLAIDAGTGSCRAVLFDSGRVARSPSASGSTSHPELPGVPGSQVFDTEANWHLICECVREALDAAGVSADAVAAVSATSMREGMVLYDARGRRDLGLPERRLARRRGGRGARPLRRGAGDLRPRRRLGRDHRAGALPLDRAPRAGRLRVDRARRHARRLDPDEALRRVRHRSVARLELRHVRARRARLVGPRARALRARPLRLPARRRAGHGRRHGHARGGGADRACAKARRSSSAAPTRSSGCSGSASRSRAASRSSAAASGSTPSCSTSR